MRSSESSAKITMNLIGDIRMSKSEVAITEDAPFSSNRAISVKSRMVVNCKQLAENHM